MFRNTVNWQKLLDKATNHTLMEPDWETIVQICDLIRQNDVQPKILLAELKKKLFSHNQHTAYYGLHVLEAIVKNCGPPVHDEVSTRTFCETLQDLAKSTTSDLVKNKLLELIQSLSTYFAKNPKYGAIKDLMNEMKAGGFTFPAVREADAMFTADSAPDWADGEVCHRCRAAFTLINRKHHCRNCGQVFCGACSSNSMSLPHFGIEKDVRVCDNCFNNANKIVQKVEKDTDLPADYLASPLSKQSQLPPPRDEQAIREEEELNLALAISQSEAEARQQRTTGNMANFSGINNKMVDFRTPLTALNQQQQKSPSPIQDDISTTNPELAHYLNRSYWESMNDSITEASRKNPTAVATIDHYGANSPSAPSNVSTPRPCKENGIKMENNGELDEFMGTLKSQVEIFINRMKSNSSRGRSIANDSSVQTLFMNITAMHSQLLRYIQQHDDKRLYYERLQDKLTQIRDARAALDALRAEHCERLRREAEEAERQRQMQMAHKLELMRKKKQEYLQYQRQLALQRIQEQEREMQIRQEQQKQQYLMGPTGGVYAATYVPPPQSQPPSFHMAYAPAQPPPPASQYISSAPPSFNMVQPQFMGPPPGPPHTHVVVPNAGNMAPPSTHLIENRPAPSTGVGPETVVTTEDSATAELIKFD